MLCPKCKRAYLTVLDESFTQKTLECNNCGLTVQVKTEGGKVLDVVVPGLALATGTAALLAFFGVKDYEALKNLISKIRF